MVIARLVDMMLNVLGWAGSCRVARESLLATGRQYHLETTPFRDSSDKARYTPLTDTLCSGCERVPSRVCQRRCGAYERVGYR